MTEHGTVFDEGDVCLYYGRLQDINAIRRMTDAEFRAFKSVLKKEYDEYNSRDETELLEDHKKPVTPIPGYVYVVKSNGFVKIGISKNIKFRIKSISSSNPSKVVLLKSWFCRDSVGVELKLHSEYSKFRVKGEWFKLPVNTLKRLLQSNFS